MENETCDINPLARGPQVLQTTRRVASSDEAYRP